MKNGLSRTILAVAMLLMLGSHAARAFVPLNPNSVTLSARWSAVPTSVTGSATLDDGLSVAIEPGLAETLILTTLGSVTPEDVADLEDVIRASFAAWESPVLAFDLEFDGPVVRGATLGREIDVMVLPGNDPAFTSTGALFGLTVPQTPFDSQRRLTNGTVLAGNSTTGADIFLNKDNIGAFAPALGTRDAKLAALQRLVMHELGHALGLSHPEDFVTKNLDTDGDPLNAMVIDPTSPLTGLIHSPAIDGNAVMTRLPTDLLNAITATDLSNDERGGRDVLYPAPPAAICPPIPRTHCRTAQKSTLGVRIDPTDAARTKLVWKWSKGAATTLAELGDPLAARTYGLCLYSDDDPARLMTLRVPSNPVLWKPSGTTGFTYRDATGQADGVVALKVKSGPAGKPKISVLSKGAAMPAVVLGGLTAPITVQLVTRDASICFEAIYVAADMTLNDASALKARHAE